MPSLAIWEINVRDRRGVYHREVHFPGGRVSLICESPRDHMVMVPSISAEVDEWQLCDGCYSRRFSDMPG